MNNSNPVKVLSLAGQLVATVSCSSVANISPQLPQGIYAVWTTSNTTVINVPSPTAPLSTSFTSTTGYPLYVGAKPEQIEVPVNGQIAGIALSSASTLSYVKVG